MNKKKILILGTGNAQTDAFEYLKTKEHIETFAVSYKNEGRGIALADNFDVVNIVDIPEVEKYARKKNIDIIYSIGSDIAMPTVSEVSKRLALPCFIDPMTAIICNNKELMRNALLAAESKWNIKYAKGNKLSDFENWEAFPAIIKPVDSQGQRGVFELLKKEDIKKHFEKSISYSKKGEVIIEEYIEGKEYSINVYVVRGEIKFFAASGRDSLKEYPGGIVKGHRMPPFEITEGLCEKFKELSKDVLNILKIENGPAYFQIKIGSEGPKVIEVTPRFDGCHMHKVISLCCGVDLLDICFKHLIGEGKIDFPKENAGAFCAGRAAAYYLEFMLEKPGSVFDREKYSGMAMGSLQTVYYYETGEKVRELNGYMEKCGYVIKKV